MYSLRHGRVGVYELARARSTPGTWVKWTANSKNIIEALIAKEEKQ